MWESKKGNKRFRSCGVQSREAYLVDSQKSAKPSSEDGLALSNNNSQQAQTTRQQNERGGTNYSPPTFFKQILLRASLRFRTSVFWFRVVVSFFFGKRFAAAHVRPLNGTFRYRSASPSLSTNIAFLSSPIGPWSHLPVHRARMPKTIFLFCTSTVHQSV